MFQCPFCDAEIDQGLSDFGGNCPYCFTYISGTEVETDPGDQRASVDAKKEQRRDWLRVWVPVLAVLPIVIVVVWYALRLTFAPAPQAVVFNFDDDAYGMPELILEYVDASEDPKSGETDGDGTRAIKGTPGKLNGARAVTKQGSNFSLGGQSGAKLPLSDEAMVQRRSATDRRSKTPVAPDINNDGVGSTSASSWSLSPEVVTARRGAVLSDGNEIRDMIRTMMASEHIPTLKRCYDRQLKQNEAFQGRWRLAFTVTQAGRVQSPKAEGVQTSHAVFEQCLEARMKEWRFLQIAANQPVQKSVTFAPTR